MARIVLSDASPIIALARVEGLAWLRGLFGRVWMPEEVRREVVPGTGFPEEVAIETAIRRKWLAVETRQWNTPVLPDLDEGEAACIRAAANSRRASLILIDERAGREVAKSLGIRVAGTAAVIGMARRRGLIPSARAVFEQLLADDFRLSPQIIRAVLDQVGE